MLDLNLSALLARLNPTTADALNMAAGVCISRGHYEITLEHHLDALLDEPGTDLPILLERFEIDQRRLRAALREQLDGLRTGNPGKPVFSPLLIEWFQDAWLIGSVEFGYTELRGGTLLLALALRSSRYATAAEAKVLSGVSRETMRADLPRLLANSLERVETATGGADPDGETGEAGAPSAGSALGRFTQDFTAAAREGRIDPVFGRDQEIRQMIDVLARRRKNNPILVGEPGVGKSAVVEGMALQIVSGRVPETLQGVRLLSLDLGALQAGAGVKGEFESRLKAVINEVKASATPIVLFIDEAHTIIGAGGSEGGSDAANLLKPALARGELRTIAATTWKEYKKYFEKDPALTRRFELVNVPEPSPESAIIMLRGLAERYADSHKVHIQDDAVVAAVTLSHRYLSGRQLPDKAVGLLDTAAARVRIGQSAAPMRLEGLWRQAEQLKRELDSHRADLASGVPGVEDRTADLAEKIRVATEAAAAVEIQWQQERDAATRVIALRRELLAKPAEGEPVREPCEVRAELAEALGTLANLQGEQPLVFPDVGPETIAAVVSEWTGIPVGRMVKDEAAAVLRFEAEMGTRIKGQDHALQVIGERVRQAKAGLHDPSQPLGVFLLVGPSGVGKTETALGLADLLYGGERSVITINMSEFKDKSTVNRLIGSPPGFVGYGEGGKLTEAVRQRPYSVVLLDECEKADPEVMELFYQVFDKGTLTDGEGREVDFKNTIILLTSNLASARIAEIVEEGGIDDHETLVAEIRPALNRHFKPALLARMTVVPYYPLPQDTLRDIATLKLGKVANRLKETHKLTLEWNSEVTRAIAARCTEVETGARNVDHILRGTILPLLSAEILGRIGVESLPQTLSLVIGEGGRLKLQNLEQPTTLDLDQHLDQKLDQKPVPNLDQNLEVTHV